jgi:CRP-like cAMP-binding protein
LLVAVSQRQLGTGAHGFGYLLAGLGVGGVLMAPVVNHLAASRRLATIIVAGMALYCLPTGLLVVLHAPGLAFVVEVVRGAGTLVVDVLAVTALQRSVAPELVSRVFGVYFALVLAAISLGAILAPLLVNGPGLHPALLALAFGPVLLGLLGYPALLNLDRAAGARLRELEPRIALLEHLGIFASASRTVLERLAAVCHPLTVSANTVIVAEGQPADALFVLAAGQVEVSVQAATGSRSLRTMEAENYFGEIGLLAGIPRTATVTALTHCDLYRIEANDFLEALTTLPPATAFLDVARSRLARTHPALTPTFAVGSVDDADGSC